MAEINPLNQQHLDRLNKLLKACAETSAYCARCTRCGLDVNREDRINNEQQAVATKIKAEFFPNEK